MSTTPPSTSSDNDARQQQMLAKVAKLLAKAEKAGTPEEAETYSAKAEELMVRYSIDSAMLGQQPESTDKVGSRRFEVRFYPKPKVSLLSGIAHAFGAEAVYYPSTANRGALVVMVYGWESDLAMIEVLFASLNVQADREAKQRWHVIYHSGNKQGLHGKSFTTSFLVGFAGTVTARLENQRHGAVQEAEDTAPGTVLVLRDRKAVVTDAFHKAHPRTRSGSGSSISSHLGYYSGQDAGRKADLGTGSGRLSATGNRALGPATR